MLVLVSLTTIPLSERKTLLQCPPFQKRMHAVPCPPLVRSWPFSLLVYSTELYCCSAVLARSKLQLQRQGGKVSSRPLPTIHLSSAVSQPANQPASNSSQWLDIHHHRGTSSNSTVTVANEPNNKFLPGKRLLNAKVLRFASAPSTTHP